MGGLGVASALPPRRCAILASDITPQSLSLLIFKIGGGSSLMEDCEGYRRQCTHTPPSMCLRVFTEGIPWWPLVKTLSFHCRRPGFDP